MSMTYPKYYVLYYVIISVNLLTNRPAFRAFKLTGGKMITQSQNITLSLPQSLVAELKNYAKEFNLKQSHIAREALENYFDDLDIALAQKRADEELIPADKVWESLGI